MSKFALTITFLALFVPAQAVLADKGIERIEVGETFTMRSDVLSETRRINVFMPTIYGEPVETPLPVLYMLDGGVDEDLLHIAGLLQVMVSNGSMRPFLLVGIENTERRRDMTGPSDDPQDQAMAENIGGAAAFRGFLERELFAEIESRYDVKEERAIIGESLAGLFVIDTLVKSPTMFDSYIAVDPSVWWNQYALNQNAAAALGRDAADGRRLFLASGREAGESERFRAFVSELDRPSVGVEFVYSPMPEESHATLFHPAAMKAMRTMFSSGEER